MWLVGEERERRRVCVESALLCELESGRQKTQRRSVEVRFVLDSGPMPMVVGTIPRAQCLWATRPPSVPRPQTPLATALAIWQEPNHEPGRAVPLRTRARSTPRASGSLTLSQSTRHNRIAACMFADDTAPRHLRRTSMGQGE